MKSDFYALSALAVGTYVLYRWIFARRLKLAPGPRPMYPFIGNVLDMPFDKQYETFAEWGKQFGDVIHVKIFQRHTLILNSFEAARDLMIARSGNYSCRPRLVLLREMLGWDTVSHFEYGDRLRRHRRVIQGQFSPQAIVRFQPVQRTEMLHFMHSLLKTPSTWVDGIRRFTAATIIRITYGHRARNDDDFYVKLTVEAATKSIATGGAGSVMVDFFPILRFFPAWFPGVGFKRAVEETRVVVQKAMDLPFEMVKKAMAEGTAVPSFTSSLLLDKGTGQGFTEDIDIRSAAGVLYAAGADTTSSLIHTFFLAMTLRPDVAKKAQAEIDSVVGKERLPDFSDRPNLPYIEKILWELYRWDCPVPLGLPHRTMKEDSYRGYDIPEDTMILGNIWAMTRNEETYGPRTEEFRPERFEGLDEETMDRVDPKNFVFGFGRRICPGMFFGESSIWIVIVNVLASFDISKAKDSAGNEIEPSVEFCSGFVRHPNDFPCVITPRSNKTADVIHQTIATQSLDALDS